MIFVRESNCNIKTKNTMRKVSLLFVCLFAALTMVSCGGGGSVEGKWGMDGEAMFNMMLEKAPEAQKAMFEPQKDKMIEKFNEMTFEFTKDGKFIISGGPKGEKEEGTYKVEGKNLVTEMKGKKETIPFTVSGGTLTITKDEMSMPFKRK